MSGVTCGSQDERVTHSVFRYFFYERWALLYNSSVSILLADYTNTFFQSSPFLPLSSSSSTSLSPLHRMYPYDWRRDTPLLAFSHFSPHSLLRHTQHGSQVFSECYGPDALLRLSHTHLTSATSFLGTRDGVLLWSHAMTGELQEAPGRYSDTTCRSESIVLALCHWLLHANKLRGTLSIGRVPQGEGPVHVLDGLYTYNTQRMNEKEKKMIRLSGSLHEYWKLLNETNWVLNWEGEGHPSPVVQYKNSLTSWFPLQSSLLLLSLSLPGGRV